MTRLKIVEVKALDFSRRDPLDPEACPLAKTIVDDVRVGGEAALRKHAEKLGDVDEGGKLFMSRDDLKQAYDSISQGDRALLERVAARIKGFALAQRESIREFEIEIPGGRAGQRVAPVCRAGCYAPGGRYPLPSTVLMTAVTAKVAGVDEVWVASPKPTALTLAAAYVAGADGLLAVGGAQAIAALSFGAGPIHASDVVAGPGNKFVTAAKKICSGNVGIDMLAGPSELTVLADESSDPKFVAADLIGQAEHDPDAIPVLVTTDDSLVRKVNAEIGKQLEGLETSEIAEVAFENGFAVVANDIDEAVSICDRISPEHLEIQTRDAERVGGMCRNYGALFIGKSTAEVLGDYGAGPNHTLPTGGSARFTGGLSVMHFLSVRTWIEMDGGEGGLEILRDAVRLGEIEGLMGHVESAKLRLT